jgi:hypothetical protein
VPDQWGLVHPVGLEVPPHVVLHLRLAPEGGILVGECERCGGRSETLLDIRPGEFDIGGCGASPLSSPRAFAEASTRAFDSEVQRLEAEWASTHAACATAPQGHVACPEAHRFLDAVVRAAGTRLRRRGEVMPTMYLLFATGRYAVVDLTASPESHTEETGRLRSIELAALHHGVRESIRQSQVEVVAMVVATEVLYAAEQDLSEHRRGRGATRASRAPDRAEGFYAALATESYGFEGLAPVRRSPRGRGRFEPPHLRPISGPNRLIEGVLATRRVIRPSG